MALIRIVRMSIAPDHVEDFLTAFDEAAPRIREIAGCEHLELWHETSPRPVFVTYSVWQTEEALESYRKSTLFRTTWAEIKTYFVDRPSAESFELLRRHS